ncbi:MAG TPA: hypothetical protein VKR06_31345 [Ktedonosporobacter sp.]|nr:hypothetical protein [Ktedonosporobacter sp.]
MKRLLSLYKARSGQAWTGLALVRLGLLKPFLLLLLLSLASCWGGSQPPSGGTSGTPTVSPSAMPTRAPTNADAIILDMLTNIKANGYNGDPGVNKGLGGLWINWRYGTNPLEVNLNGSGYPDGDSKKPPRHDVLTDLRYIHALWLYKSQHPNDTQFDSEIARYTPIVKNEWAQPKNERGWLYDELIDIYHLSQNTFYQQAAHDLVSFYFTTLYHPATGLIYKVDAQHPQGFYRVDLALESACALIQASTVFNEPSWQDAGQKIIKNLYATAYLPQHHAFLYVLNNVIMPDGSMNMNPDIYRGVSGHTKIEGAQVRMGAVAQQILSLLHVYIVTHDKTFLDHATDLLDPLTIDNNSLGLWDTEHEGYFSAVVFPGPNVQNIGMPKVSGGTKESGRQVQLLEAFSVANKFTNNRYQRMQDELLKLTIGKAYYPAGHGVVYEMSPDWQIRTLKNGQPEDWVTTEAMGIVIESLYSTMRSDPW